MQLIFTNPLGIWMLLGLPAVLLIHFFQQQSRPIAVSTLFLVEKLSPRSIQGTKFERLRSSLPLLFQLLVVVIAAWICLQPRFVKTTTFQRIILVLDSSFSMSAFQQQLSGTLLQRLEQLARLSTHTEWIVLDSDLEKPPLYKGRDLKTLAERLLTWHPHLGAHDLTAAIEVAQVLAGRNGVVIAVSDHQQELPSGTHFFSIGNLLENCGFTGFQIETERQGSQWKAVLKNYGSHTQKREWWLKVNGTDSGHQSISLKPVELRTLSGSFPPGENNLQLVLSPDGFTLDDYLPLLRPIPKELNLYAESDITAQKLAKKFLITYDGLRLGETHNADVSIKAISASAPMPLQESAIVFSSDSAQGRSVSRNAIFGENHRLNEDLSWQTLRVVTNFPFSLRDSDEPLVWAENKPLIFLRHTEKGKQLFFNFAVEQTNIQQLPDFVILIHRFLEMIRQEKLGEEQTMVEMSQQLPLPSTNVAQPIMVEVESLRHGSKTQSTLALHQVTAFRAPAEPAYFTIRSGKTNYFHGASYFADSQEADFSKAEAIDTIETTLKGMMDNQSEEDFLFPLWVLVLGLLLAASWMAQVA